LSASYGLAILLTAVVPLVIGMSSRIETLESYPFEKSYAGTHVCLIHGDALNFGFIVAAVMSCAISIFQVVRSVFAINKARAISQGANMGVPKRNSTHEYTQCLLFAITVHITFWVILGLRINLLEVGTVEDTPYSIILAVLAMILGTTSIALFVFRFSMARKPLQRNLRRVYPDRESYSISKLGVQPESLAEYYNQKFSQPLEFSDFDRRLSTVSERVVETSLNEGPPATIQVTEELHSSVATTSGINQHQQQPPSEELSSLPGSMMSITNLQNEVFCEIGDFDYS